MNEERARRKLTAILSADVKGYSRLMGEDELATIETLKKYRILISSLIEQFQGRVVDSPGDNLLTEFGSVVDAVECAVKIQEELKKENDLLPENRRMDFRIGVNLGDVVEDEERIYGEGVNIAARIESLADAGGICISSSAYDQVKRKLNFRYDYLGEHQIKNIDEPLIVYKVLMESESKGFPEENRTIKPASIERMVYSLPDKPSIAVLPFTNMSGDSSIDYIGDGLSENIINALSISSKIFVIARNSTFTYKEKPVKVQRVAEELGVQYVLEGSIQKSGDRLRVIAQLIDALSGHHLWSERYDRKMKDLFDLQDEITKKIIVSLHVELTRGEDIRLYEKSTDCLEALGHHIKGLELFNEHTKEDNAKAREQFKVAIKLDPEFVTAWALLASTYLIDVQGGWSDSPSDSLRRAFELAQKAMKLDDKDAVVHSVLGTIYLYQKQHEKAITEGKKSITLNPNFPIGHTMLARTMLFSGQFEESIELIKKAMRLNPRLHPSWLSYMARSYIFLGRDEEALEVINQMEELPGGYPSIGVSIVYQRLGKEDKARAHVVEVLKINPHFSLESLKMVEPFKNPAHLQRELDILHKAGLPEKPRQPVQDTPSIAVLPFINMSNDPEQEYFSDGMTEELISVLAKLEGLKVISRTSAFYFKGKDVDLRTIGEKLKVDNVLEGSVRKARNKLRISAQLIKVDDDTHLWAETYDRELEDVFAIQDEISQVIVKNLKVKLLGKEDERLVKDYTKNTVAYELYLKGRFFYSKGISWLGKAIEYYERTIKADPDFAPAYSKLAITHFGNTIVFSQPSKEMWPKAKTLVLKALDIDEMDADAHTLMGKIKSCYEYDWAGAETYCQRAIELNPGYSEAHFQYATYLIGVGRGDEAIEKMKRALELDPFSIFFNGMLGLLFYFTRQFDKAIAQSQKALELAPDDPTALETLALSLAEKGLYEEGIKMLQQVRNIPLETAIIGYLYGKAGKREEAQKILDDFLERSKRGYFSPYLVATVYSGMGEKDKVFEWLGRAYVVRDPLQWKIKVDGSFADLHSDPRWAEYMKKMGLAD